CQCHDSFSVFLANKCRKTFVIHFIQSDYKYNLILLYTVAGGVWVLSESLQEISVKLPKNLLNEVDGLMKYENRDLSDFICQATKNYLESKKSEHIQQFHESMQQGYKEMARINLSIASEAFQAEEEADTTLERSVIGV